MCDIPEQIATDTTKHQGLRRVFPEKLRKDGSVKKPSRVVINMKNRAYPTLASALEQIHAYASHTLVRTNGGAHNSHDHTGCGVPVGVMFTTRGAVNAPAKGKHGGHYRIKWGYEVLRPGYIQQKKCVYSYDDADEDADRVVGRSPSMLYQPDHHDKSGVVAQDEGDRKTIQSSLVWIYSGALSAVQSYGQEGDAGCFHNKRKWDGFYTDEFGLCEWANCDGKDGTRRYYKKIVDGVEFQTSTSHTCPHLVEFNRPPASKNKKKRKGKKKQSSSATEDTSAADLKKALQQKKMMAALAADSDDEFDSDVSDDTDSDSDSDSD